MKTSKKSAASAAASTTASTTALENLKVGTGIISNSLPFTLIAGPCVMESEKHLWQMATSLQKITRELNLQLVFKCSYDKANRTSIGSYRGPGVKEGLKLLASVKKKLGLTLLTDVHLPSEVETAAEVADILQVPAFLCRQTDLLTACARSKKIVNVKKGQFVSPWEMRNVVQKILASGNPKIMLTERGTSFGYNNLIVDMRALEIMKSFGVPVIFDATHSVQLPGGQGGTSGGQREFVEPLARAACAIGVAGIFMEVHPDPDQAWSDGANSIKLAHLKSLLQRLIAIDQTAKN